MEGGGDSGKDDTSEKDMEEDEEDECKITFNFELIAFILFSVSTKITDAIGKLSSNSSSPKWKRSPEDEVDFGTTSQLQQIDLAIQIFRYLINRFQDIQSIMCEVQSISGKKFRRSRRRRSRSKSRRRRRSS